MADQLPQPADCADGVCPIEPGPSADRPAGLAARLAAGFGRLLAWPWAWIARHWPGRKLLTLTSEAEFNAIVLGETVPVLVEFYKPGCPTCVWLEPRLDRLAQEYHGRAIIAKYRVMNSLFIHTSWAVSRRYGVYFVPTVLLFANGREVERWFMDYKTRHYRKALDRAIAEQATEPTAPAAPIG